MKWQKEGEIRLEPSFIHQTLSLRREGIVYGVVSMDSSLGYSDRGESSGTLFVAYGRIMLLYRSRPASQI